VVADDIEFEAETPDEGATPMTEQFPAVGGDVQGEIEQRSPDGADEGRFVKTFVVDSEVSDDSAMHAMNANGVVQEAIQRGLHPKGDVFLVDRNVIRHERSVSTELTYAVEVTPASIDHEPETTVTPSDLNEAKAEEPAAEEPAPKPTRRRSTKTTK
jgi:hypothetical protein